MKRPTLSLKCLFGGHTTIRERRLYKGVEGVSGFCCLQCGVWRPVLERSQEDYVKMKALGAGLRLPPPPVMSNPGLHQRY